MHPRLLLVRSDHLGDVVFTLPAAPLIRRLVPSARITYLVQPALEALPARCPAVDEVIGIPFPPVLAPYEAAAWRDVVARHAPALRGRFDAALLLRPEDPWSGALAHAAGIPVRVGCLEPRTRGFLTHGIDHRADLHASDLARRIAVAALAAIGVAAPGTEAADAGPVLVPTEADRREAAEALDPLVPRVGTRPAIIHPGVGWRLKRWPPERWGQVAAGVHAEFGRRVVVVGGPDEGGLVDAVVAAGGGAAMALPTVVSVGGLAGLLERAAAVAACDSGPFHLAAALGTPAVGLYGPADPVAAAPLSAADRHRVLRLDLPCAPCRELVDPPCGAAVDPACMAGLGVDAVVEALGEVAGWRSAHPTEAPARPETGGAALA
ncbi:MAG TPA: glycosyltransferase family 9 protein [Actinomycetota bacterium]|nr:glycosyltransferase family 9 protein [Actinomycetota bacterium]